MTIEQLKNKRQGDSVLDKAQFMIYGGIWKRDFAFYMDSLNLSESELRGKKILDIGAGAALFAKKAKKEGVDVTALDPMYALDDGLHILKKEGEEEYTKLKDWLPKAVSAVGQNMPFRKNHFDMAISVFSSFFYSENEKELWENLNETLRVIKPGGKLYIFSIFPLQNKKDISVMIQNDLNNSNDTLTKKFLEILDNLESQQKIRWEIKKPNNPRKGYESHEYISIDVLKK